MRFFFHVQVVLRITADDDVQTSLQWSVLDWNTFPSIPSHYHCILHALWRSRSSLGEILEIFGKMPGQCTIFPNTVGNGGSDNDSKTRHDDLLITT